MHHTLDFLFRHGIQALETHRRLTPLDSGSASLEDGDSRWFWTCFGSNGLTMITEFNGNQGSPEIVQLLQAGRKTRREWRGGGQHENERCR
jgi:hypothetical protein